MIVKIKNEEIEVVENCESSKECKLVECIQIEIVEIVEIVENCEKKTECKLVEAYPENLARFETCKQCQFFSFRLACIIIDSVS